MVESPANVNQGRAEAQLADAEWRDLVGTPTRRLGCREEGAEEASAEARDAFQTVAAPFDARRRARSSRERPGGARRRSGCAAPRGPRRAPVASEPPSLAVGEGRRRGLRLGDGAERFEEAFTRGRARRLTFEEEAAKRTIARGPRGHERLGDIFSSARCASVDAPAGVDRAPAARATRSPNALAPFTRSS